MRSDLANHCRKRFLVLDHSKFGRSATVRGGHIAETSSVFTDQPPPPRIMAMLNEAGVKLVVVPRLQASSGPLPPFLKEKSEMYFSNIRRYSLMAALALTASVTLAPAHAQQRVICYICPPEWAD